MEINIYQKVGSFAENKDIAKKIRIKEILPILDANSDIILDFKDVESATQSFIHALISDVIRKHGIEVLDKITFKNCNITVKKIIEIVIEYMQDHT
ncbi:MAG: STAS-like domain-containing protein [Nanoarchaeota archaeon]